METPEESAERKFANQPMRQEHYIKILKWLMEVKGRPHKTAIKIAYHHTMNKFIGVKEIRK